jgi:hypothetical protein
MKRKIMLLLLSTFIFFIGCKKDKEEVLLDLSFRVNEVSSIQTKSGSIIKSDTIICSGLRLDYVKLKINNGNFQNIPIFNVGGIYYTSSIKLPVGNHMLNEFIVYNNNNTPNDQTDDIVVSATPHVGSLFGGYVTTPLDVNIQISEDKKNEVKIDVVCFDPTTYQNFGFVYFQLNQLIIRQLWFYGDFCIRNKNEYNNSLYSQQTNWNNSSGLYIDVPAIIKVEVFRNGILQNTFTNSTQGEKLSVNYGDYINTNESFLLKLYVYVKEGTQFNYKLFKEFTFNNVSNILQGSDGIVDFVLGGCYDPNSPPDYIFPEYMNLPPTLTYTITAQPSTMGGYVDATLTNTPSGYVIQNGVYPSNCADHTQLIYLNTPYNMDVYSSLYVDKLPLFIRNDKWKKINWLYNNLDMFGSYTWYDLQQAIWLFDTPQWNGQPLAGVPAVTSKAQQMYTSASNYGSNFIALPGDYIAVIFVPAGTPITATSGTVQTVFIQIN